MKREPFVGEDVTTPKGEGTVLSVRKWKDHTDDEKMRKAKSLKAKMGSNFASTYFEIEVEFVEGDEGKSTIEKFECWEIEYDTTRDPEDAPWRAPRDDS